MDSLSAQTSDALRPDRIPVLDFTSAEAFVPVASTLTVTGVSNSDIAYAGSAFYTATGSSLPLFGGAIVNGIATIHEVPTSRLLATDIHELEASVSNYSARTGRALVHFYHDVGNKTLARAPASTPNLNTARWRWWTTINRPRRPSKLTSIGRGERAAALKLKRPKRSCPDMAESVYKVIELVGSSSESWEKAAAAAIKLASKTLRDLRIAEVTQQDMVLSDGKIEAYRVKLSVSFKYDGK